MTMEKDVFSSHLNLILDSKLARPRMNAPVGWGGGGWQ